MTAETEQVEAGPDTSTGDEPRRPRDPLVLAGAALVAVAVVCAAVFGVLWLTASHDESAQLATMRDQALQAAEQGSINLTTLDYRHIQQDLARWRSSTTGDLLTQLSSSGLSASFTTQAVQAKSVTKGTVTDGVITMLDPHAGKATALVYMSVSVAANGTKPTAKPEPLQWDLTLTSSGWKLSGIVSSGGSSTSPTAPATPTVPAAPTTPSGH